MAGNISGQTTNLSSLAIGALNSNNTTVGFLDLATNMAVMSMQTRANFSGMTTNQVRVVFATSGLSIVWSSGKSVYDVGSATSAAQN